MNLITLRNDPHARQFAKFVIVGLMTTLINFTVYGLLLLAGIHYLRAAVIAFAIATLNSYTFNRRWTFRAGAHRTERLVKFTAVQLVGLTINLLLLFWLVENFALNKFLAQVLANSLVVVTGFVGNKFWTFRS